MSPDPIRRETARHAVWDEVCDAFHLLDRQDLSVVQEVLPAGTVTEPHAHQRSRQFFYVLSGTATWPFGGGNQAREVRISGRFASNSIEAIREACLGGLGLALLSRWDVVEELKSGTLVPVELDALAPQEISIWAVYPSPRLVAPKVRAFIAALERALGELST